MYGSVESVGMLDADVREVALVGEVGDVDVVRHGCHSSSSGSCADLADLGIHEASSRMSSKLKRSMFGERVADGVGDAVVQLRDVAVDAGVGVAGRSCRTRDVVLIW